MKLKRIQWGVRALNRFVANTTDRNRVNADYWCRVVVSCLLRHEFVRIWLRGSLNHYSGLFLNEQAEYSLSFFSMSIVPQSPLLPKLFLAVVEFIESLDGPFQFNLSFFGRSRSFLGGWRMEFKTLGIRERTSCLFFRYFDGIKLCIFLFEMNNWVW